MSSGCENTVSDATGGSDLCWDLSHATFKCKLAKRHYLKQQERHGADSPLTEAARLAHLASWEIWNELDIQHEEMCKRGRSCVIYQRP